MCLDRSGHPPLQGTCSPHHSGKSGGRDPGLSLQSCSHHWPSGENSSRRNPWRATTRVLVTAPAVLLHGLCSPSGLDISCACADLSTLLAFTTQIALSTEAEISSIIRAKPFRYFATFLPEQRSSKNKNKPKPKSKAQINPPKMWPLILSWRKYLCL